MALKAKDPGNFDSVPDLTEQGLDAIHDEVRHKWRQPAALYFTIVICPIGATVQ